MLYITAPGTLARFVSQVLGGRIPFEVREMEAALICSEEPWSWGVGKNHPHCSGENVAAIKARTKDV
jgi:hypothetical protein